MAILHANARKRAPKDDLALDLYFGVGDVHHIDLKDGVSAYVYTDW
jgi:hypothetical protein